MIAKTYYYFRYVKDTFTSFSSRSQAEDFFSYLNNLHPSLKYTMAVEENNQLPFRLSNSVNHKPTFNLLGFYLLPEPEKILSIPLLIVLWCSILSAGLAPS